MKSFKLGTQLNIAFFIALFVPMAVATLYSIIYYSHKIEQEALHTASAELQVASLIYDNKLTEMRDLARAYGQRKTVVFFFHLSLNKKLGGDLAKAARLNKVDMITLIDKDFKVVARSHNPEQFGDVIPENALLQAAFNGDILSGTELLPSAVLSQEGWNIPGGSPKRPMASEPATPPLPAGSAEIREATDPSGQTALSITSAAPVFDRARKNMVGAVLLRRVLNHEKRIVGHIHKASNVDAAIFQKEHLIACNLPRADKTRHDFATLSPEIRKTVLDQGKPFEEVDIRRGGHLAKYQPLTDIQGTPLGALMVRLNADRYAETRLTAVLSLLGIACIGFLLAFTIKVDDPAQDSHSGGAADQGDRAAGKWRLHLSAQSDLPG
jgi:hypothetical protein